jgi:hypothetical protein
MIGKSGIGIVSERSVQLQEGEPAAGRGIARAIIVVELHIVALQRHG